MPAKVLWYHAVLSAYGFWLPNDPRGSWSDFVHAWDLFRSGGPATKVSARRSHAHDPHDRASRLAAKAHLKYSPARFDPPARRSIGSGFAQACAEFGFVLHAAAIGFDHAHLIIARDARRPVEQIVAVLKARATARMKADGTHPMRHHPGCPTAWASGCWSVFIDDARQLRNAIAYVERHPMKEGLPPQHWSFVTPPA